MKKTVITLVSIILTVYLACGSSQKSESNTGESSGAASIHWARFDAALDSSSNADKPVLAYFWRDG
jgi:hypothetical protein